MFIILNIRFNYSQRYPVSFTLQDKYEINLIIWEFPSFLDAPNFFHIGIKDLDTNKKYFYKTGVIEGASFRFGVSKRNSAWILMRGFGYSLRPSQHFLIDLDKDEMTHNTEEIKNPENLEIEIGIGYKAKRIN